MPLDPAMVQAIMQSAKGQATPVGDVIPFRRQSIEPGMGLTEGARVYPGGANDAAMIQDIIKTLSGTNVDPRWAEIDKVATDQGLHITPERIQQILDLMDKHGLSMDQIKYQMALVKQGNK